MQAFLKSIHLPAARFACRNAERTARSCASYSSARPEKYKKMRQNEEQILRLYLNLSLPLFFALLHAMSLFVSLTWCGTSAEHDADLFRLSFIQVELEGILTSGLQNLRALLCRL